MKAGELIEKLSNVSPDTEIIGGTWNGRGDTYTVLDYVHVFPYDSVYGDFYGTPGAFDKELLKIRSKAVVFLGSLFDVRDKRVMEDRRIAWSLGHVLRMHRSREWKKERIYHILQEFYTAH